LVYGDKLSHVIYHNKAAVESATNYSTGVIDSIIGYGQTAAGACAVMQQPHYRDYVDDHHGDSVLSARSTHWICRTACGTAANPQQTVAGGDIYQFVRQQIL